MCFCYSSSYWMRTHLRLCYWKLFEKINKDIAGKKNVFVYIPNTYINKEVCSNRGQRRERFHLPSLWINSPSMELQSMSTFSGFFRAGYLLNRLATKAKFNLGLPRTTSGGMTNCRHPSRSAWSSMHSARFRSSFSCRDGRGRRQHFLCQIQINNESPIIR